MPQTSVEAASPVASSIHASPSFLCVCRSGSSGAWVHVRGELDMAVVPELRRSLAEASARARLVVLDLRELRSIDSRAARVVLDAAAEARRDGGRLMLVRGSAEVDNVLTLAGVPQKVLIFDLDRSEPAAGLLAGPG